MADTIGKCINNSDKLEIDRIITNDIDELDLRLTSMRKTSKELIWSKS